MDFIVSSKKKMFWYVDDDLRNRYKTRRSICTRPTVTKVFDKLSKAVSAKHTSYNWRNSEATYLILLTRYCSLDIQRNLFHRKTYFAWYEISFWFLFSVICTIANSLDRFDSNASQFSKLDFRFEVWIYLVSCVIQKMHDGFKINESVCIAKYEQQRLITIMKIFENKPKSRWLDEKIFYYYMSVLF